MSKVILEFNLPEEQGALTLAQKGGEFWRTLWNLDQECRNYLKYGKPVELKTPDDALEWVRTFINESIDLECVE